MQQPPLLPDETLTRVLRIARFGGTSVVIIAGMAALLNGAAGNTPVALFALAGAGAGAVELHGAGMLRHGDARGMNWLIASQPFLLAVILSYCAFRLTHPMILPESMNEVVANTAQKLNLSIAEFQRQLVQSYRLLYRSLALASVIYQGGMTIYYLRRRASVRQALPPQEE